MMPDLKFTTGDNKPTISRKILLDAGYKEWKENNFQKLISDDTGKRYYINCNYIEVDNFGNRLTFWEFNIHMETEHGAVYFKTAQWFNQDGTYSGKTIGDVEEYFNWLWEKHDRPYYERYYQQLEGEG